MDKGISHVRKETKNASYMLLCVFALVSYAVEAFWSEYDKAPCFSALLSRPISHSLLALRIPLTSRSIDFTRRTLSSSTLAVKLVDVLASLWRPAQLAGICRRRLPNHLSDLFADLFNSVHSPNDIKMLVTLDDLGVYDIDMWLSTVFETAYKTTAIY